MAARVATIGTHKSGDGLPGGAYLLAGGIAMFAMFLSFHPPVQSALFPKACMPAASADSCGALGDFDRFPERA